MNKSEKQIHLKCAEELNELASRLLKQVNKPNKDYSDKIRAEIVDVQLRLEYLQPLYYKNKYSNTDRTNFRIKELRKADADRDNFYSTLLQLRKTPIPSSPELTEKYQD